MSTFLSKKTWVFSTRGVDGTLTIGACFVFLAYILHPAIDLAYRRVRACRAWRAIENQKSVDVTNYCMVEELFGGRGKWDVARIVTVLLAIFSLASWGLELSMDLAYYKGEADLLNRPPPVTIKSIGGTNHWQVKTQEDLGSTDWIDLPNVFEDGAKSRYYMEANSRYEGPVNGEISVAYWHTEAARAPTQFYYLGGATATVKNLTCTCGTTGDTVDVYLGNDKIWGKVLQCEHGPSLTDDLLQLHDDKTLAPPTLVMKSSKGEVFLVVEEDISYPSFLYSIWTIGSQNGTATELQHAFHIAATMRLAEAVVTGIVHGERSGGGCFGVLRKFSETRVACQGVADRASPFGEHPAGDSVQIQELEHVEVGLNISVNALACFVCLMLLASISIAWLCSLHFSIGMDVYDRDELIRAVSMPEITDGCTVPSQMRILVRKADSGEIKVVISDTRAAHSSCARILRNRKRRKRVEGSDPNTSGTAVTPSCEGFAGAAVPMRTREVTLEGVRVRPVRSSSLPSRIFRGPASISLTTSPVPWNASSLPTTPAQYIGHARSVARVDLGYNGRPGESLVFDTVYISSDSDDDGTDVMQADCEKAGKGDGTSCAYTSTFAGRRRVAPMPDDLCYSDFEMAKQRDCGREKETLQGLRENKMVDVSEGSLPLPPPFIERDVTGPVTPCNGGKTTKNDDCSENLC